LRHSLTNNAPLQELRAVSSELNTSTGATNIIYQDSSIKSSNASTNIIGLEASNPESTQSLINQRFDHLR
jgi:hypothetical protein